MINPQILAIVMLFFILRSFWNLCVLPAAEDEARYLREVSAKEEAKRDAEVEKVLAWDPLLDEFKELEKTVANREAEALAAQRERRRADLRQQMLACGNPSKELPREDIYGLMVAAMKEPAFYVNDTEYGPDTHTLISFARRSYKRSPHEVFVDSLDHWWSSRKS